MSLSLYGDNHVFATNPRGVAGRFNATTYDPANLAMEDVQWDKSTYVLPTVLPPTAPFELRARVLALTLKTLKRSTRGDYATKAALLEQCFQCASAATRARTAANPAKNILGGAYTFTDPLIKRATGTVLNVADPPSDDNRRQAKFLEFRATFRPALINRTITDTPKSFVAAIRYPTEAETDDVIEGLETKEQWLNARGVMANILRISGAVPELLELGDVTNGRLAIKEQSVNTKMTAHYDKIYFDLLQKEIEKDYVGDAVQNAQSVVQNTRQVRMAAGRHVHDPIEVYLKRYASALDLLDEDLPYPINIVSTCHQNMSDITKKQIKTIGWTEPPKAATNAGHHALLSQIRTIVIRAEEAIKTTRLITGTRRANHFGNTNSAFSTTPMFATTVGNDNDEYTLLPPLPEVQVARPPGPPPDNLDGTVATEISTLTADITAYAQLQILLGQPVPLATLQEEAREFQIFLSNS